MIQIDMEMPKCCDECFALDDHGDYPFCLISQDQRGYTFNVRKRRMPTCPLKAQEPRVLSEVELRGIQDEIPVWIEIPFEGCDIGHWVLVSYHHYEYKGVKFSFDEGLLDGLGAKWRCWTSRPDQAIREATPWN